MSDSIPLKRCARKDCCIHPDGPWLPATSEYFHRNKSTKDGFERYCRPCKLAANNRWRDKPGVNDARNERRRNRYHEDEEHREQIKANSRQYIQDNPAVVEHRKIYLHDYYQKPEVRLRQNSKRRQRYHENPDISKRQLEGQKRRRKTPDGKARDSAKQARRRSRKKGAEGTHNATDIALQIKAQTNKGGRLLCWWCGKPIKGKYHVDHRIPLSKGGTNWPSNIVIAHGGCNQSKCDKLPWELGRLL